MLIFMLSFLKAYLKVLFSQAPSNQVHHPKTITQVYSPEAELVYLKTSTLLTSFRCFLLYPYLPHLDLINK